MVVSSVSRQVGVGSLVAVVAAATLLAACETVQRAAISVEEAKQITASLAGASLVPPPRTVRDITEILDQQKPADLEAALRTRQAADQSRPATTSPAVLAEFYHLRGLAAREMGRTRQEIADLREAAQWAERDPTGAENRALILTRLGQAEIYSGNFTRGVQHLRQAIEAVPSHRRGRLIPRYSDLAHFAALAGDLDTAEAAVREAQSVFDELKASVGGHGREHILRDWTAHLAEARATIAEVKGQLAEAETLYRQAIPLREQDPHYWKSLWLDLPTARLPVVLARQGRLVEAENEARAALLRALRERGRYSTHTAAVLRVLTRAIFEQGRYAEAETLARAVIDIYQKAGVLPDSLLLATAREELGAALAAQGRWPEALAEYETIRRGMSGDPEAFSKFFAANVDWALVLLNNGQIERAVEVLTAALERRRRALGDRHASTAEVRGLFAMALAARNDYSAALREFAAAAAVLLNRSADDIEDENVTRAAREQRVALILSSYIDLLAAIRGTAIEQRAGIEAAAEAFRVADVARGRSVQRALDASAARARVQSPALADLIRREQDASKQLNALFGALANALSVPTDQQDARAIGALRQRIDALRRSRQALIGQIEREFPAYATLINPPPAPVEQARAVLRPGEAWIVTYVGPSRTYVWAIPQAGPLAFAAVPVGDAHLEAEVRELRRALEPNARTLGEIPAFDVARAHALYRALLEPVAAGWQKAESLLVVPHGPLGQLPLSLLPTRPVPLPPERDVLFANYRGVPWLVRAHAVTVLPSVASLATLRGLPAGDPTRRPFVGFGDPYFSEAQARRAEARESTTIALTQVGTRGVPIALRASPRTAGLDSGRLAMLPRLPDTAEEVRSIALALNADLTKEVFLGVQANEQVVKTHDLTRYRVIAFATHGLVPGELDGLTQPALALTAPEVARVEGDGLLTMEEILGLRLNADWVVLSACNTASGRGAGAEAVSGLGRAFFYAGARALLVSSWPVETTSARALTTDVFGRQQADPRLTRARALQQAKNGLIDGPGFVNAATNTTVFSYAHPIFWAPFVLVGDGGGAMPR